MASFALPVIVRLEFYTAVIILRQTHDFFSVSGEKSTIELPTKQGFITPVSGYKSRISHSVSLQSGLAQAERDRGKAAASHSSKEASVQKSRSDDGLKKSESSVSSSDNTPSSGQTVVDRKTSNSSNIKDPEGDSPPRNPPIVMITPSESSASLSTEDNVDIATGNMDKKIRPQSLPLSSWDDTADEKSTAEERGVASGESSPNLIDEMANRLEMLPQPTDDACREKASHGEWYGAAQQASKEQHSLKKPHFSSSQESIEA